MADELSELDELIESDVLEALGEKVAEDDASVEIDGITIEDIEAPAETVEEESEIAEESLEETPQEPTELDEDSDEEITIEDLEQEVEPEPEIVQEQEKTEENVQTVSSTDLASLLSQLLNNKTIEITIKIKD